MPESVTISRAARELGLKQREAELAVQLGEVRGHAGPQPDRPRLPSAELARLAADPEAVRALRDRLRLVGTAEGAALLGVAPGRFTRLARTGCLSPVAFSVNRYRAVVWLYLAHELRTFAELRPELLAGRHPQDLRDAVRAGADLRARNWRARRSGQLVRLAGGPWERAAARSAVLADADLRPTVPDPAEQERLRALRPRLDMLRSTSPVVRRIADGLSLAADEDEIGWCRYLLTAALEEARAAEQQPVAAQQPGRGRPGRRPGRLLRDWARRRSARARPVGPVHRRPTSVSLSTARPSSSEAVRSTSADRPQS
jgi:uncharacterized protein DUF6397